MKIIKKKLRTIKYLTHTSHVYLVGNPNDNYDDLEVDSQKPIYKPGDRVEIFFNDEFNKPKMKKYEAKRSKK